MQTSYVGPVRRRCHCEGEVIHVGDHDARWDAEMEGDDVDEEEKGRQWGAFGGPYRDHGRYAGGTFKDEVTSSSCEEGGDTVDHIGGYVFGEQAGPELRRVDIVKTSFYVEKEGGYLQEGSLEGSDFVGEGGHRIRGAEAGEGAALVRVTQACLSCQGGEPDCENALNDFGDSFEEDNDAEGGRGVVARFAGFVEDNSICVFESGGMVSKGDQGSQEVQEEVGVDGVQPFPDRVWHPIGARCGRGGGLGLGSRNFLLGERFG